MRRDWLSRFPHLYRCGHIEGRGPRAHTLRQGAHFRIFIDAATLKAHWARICRNFLRCFRIFIDAATLKGFRQSPAWRAVASAFPHLYRCGHIEGYVKCPSCGHEHVNFRIFIDAATLKGTFAQRGLQSGQAISASL